MIRDGRMRPSEMLSSSEVVIGDGMVPIGCRFMGQIRAMVLSVPVVSADNIDAWAYEEARNAKHGEPWRYPNLAPPFQAMVIDWRGPLGDENVALVEYVEYGVNPRRECPIQFDDTHAKWWMTIQIFFHAPKNSPWIFLGEMHAAVHEDGSSSEERLCGTSSGLPRVLADAMVQQAVTAQLAVCFIHCRNITRVENRPDEDMVRRWAKKKRRIAPVTFTTLDISPMREVLKREGGSEETGIKRALHICRGHFKTYDEKPLFGRVKGTFFWQDSVRGSSENGVVVKDYNVKGPTK